MGRKGWGRARNPWTVKGDYEIVENCNWLIREIIGYYAGIKIKGSGALQVKWAYQFASRIDVCCKLLSFMPYECFVSNLFQAERQKEGQELE
jgi:hypothetical protein